MSKSSSRSRAVPGVIPRLFAADARGLVTFVVKVFDGVGKYRRDVPSEIRIGDSIIMINDAAIRGRWPAFLYVYVPDADVACRRAVKLGAKVIEEPADMPYGDRRCMVKDKWGNTWQIATRLTSRR